MLAAALGALFPFFSGVIRERAETKVPLEYVSVLPWDKHCAPSGVLCCIKCHIDEATIDHIKTRFVFDGGDDVGERHVIGRVALICVPIARPASDQ